MLDISRNQLSNACLTTLGDALSKNKGLHTLNLSVNNFGTRMADTDFWCLLEGNQTLMECDISHTDVGDTAATQIARYLTVICIFFCLITPIR